MTDRDDYLWDRRGVPDPELAALEQALAPLAHAPRPLPRDVLPAPLPRARRRWPWWLAAAAAALVLAWSLATAEPSLAEGAPAREFTAAATARRIRLGELAEIVLAPGSRLRFEHWQRDRLRCRLEHGELTARVAPPPAVAAGFFEVDTARGLVVDQGCQYTLRVDEAGVAHVRVAEGAVTFAGRQRTVFVPAGAVTTVDDDGPRTPVFLDSSPLLQQAARNYDAVAAATRREGQPDPEAAVGRQRSLDQLVAACREPRDSLPLWHVLGDAEPALRELAERALTQLVGPPPQPPQPSKGGPDSWPPAAWLEHLRGGAWTQAR